MTGGPEIMRQAVSVILAAGAGTRMKSDYPKVLFSLAGQPMLQYVLDAASSVKPRRTLCVLGHGLDKVLSTMPDLDYVLQEEQLGTGHAFSVAIDELGTFEGDIIVLCGDTPLLKKQSLRDMLCQHRESGASVTVMTFRAPDPFGYGRIIRDKSNNVEAIVEQVELTDDQKCIVEVNAGVYIFRMEDITPLLRHLDSNNVKGEVFITDLPALLYSRGKKVSAYSECEHETTRGVNDRWSLALAERELMNRRLEILARDGVTIRDPATVRIDMAVKVMPGAVLGPYAVIEGTSVIGRATAGPFVRIVSSNVSDYTELSFCEYINGSKTSILPSGGSIS